MEPSWDKIVNKKLSKNKYFILSRLKDGDPS